MRAFAPNAILFFPNVVADMVAALTITKFCCNIIQKDGLGEGTGFLLLALTLSGKVSPISKINALKDFGKSFVMLETHL